MSWTGVEEVLRGNYVGLVKRLPRTAYCGVSPKAIGLADLYNIWDIWVRAVIFVDGWLGTARPADPSRKTASKQLI